MFEYIMLSLCSLLFGFVVFKKETQRVKKIRSFRLINLFGYMYGVTYGVLPACVLLLYKFADVNISHSRYEIDYSLEGLLKIGIWLVFAILGYVVLNFSYRASFAVKKKTAVQNDISIASQERQWKMLGKLQACAFLCFFVACISLFLWLRAYGGFWGLILIADQVRDGVSDVRNSMAFFMRPAKIILMVFFMSVFLIKHQYNTGINRILSIISFILSILMLLALDGRMGMVTFLAIGVLMVIDFFEVGNFDKKKLWRSILLCVVAVVILSNMDAVTLYLRTGRWIESEPFLVAAEGFLREFGYIFVGAQKAVSLWIDGEIPYLIGQDILAGIFAWFPSSLRPDGIINVWNYNTELCRIGTIGGQLPCDFITVSLYDLGMMGPVTLAFFWGRVIRLLDYYHVQRKDPIYDLFYYALSMRIFRLVNYCLLYDFILGSFDIFVAFVFWQICRKIRFRLH